MTDDLRGRLALPRFPRSAAYDPQWMIENVMGPNPLWLLEWLGAAVELTPGLRVLDLGCGRALTSIFMAREYGVRVTAADLWIKPSDNWARIEAAGCADLVTPLFAEAHDLPFHRSDHPVIMRRERSQSVDHDLQFMIGGTRGRPAPPCRRW